MTLMLLCCQIVVVLRHFRCLCELVKVMCCRDIVCFSCPVVLVGCCDVRVTYIYAVIILRNITLSCHVEGVLDDPGLNISKLGLCWTRGRYNFMKVKNMKQSELSRS